jgi:hypothetical protein
MDAYGLPWTSVARSRKRRNMFLFGSVSTFMAKSFVLGVGAVS